MKPTKLHYFFAQTWPQGLLTGVVFLLLVVWVLTDCRLSAAALRDWHTVLWLVAVLLLLVPVAGFGAMFVVSALLSPIFDARAMKNGTPFRPGDRVRILVGPYRDRVTLVRSECPGNWVCAELGEAARASCKDIFSPVQLLREEAPEEEQRAETPA